jgi:hypothetical protein
MEMARPTCTEIVMIYGLRAARTSVTLRVPTEGAGVPRVARQQSGGQWYKVSEWNPMEEQLVAVQSPAKL